MVWTPGAVVEGSKEEYQYWKSRTSAFWPFLGYSADACPKDADFLGFRMMHETGYVAEGDEKERPCQIVWAGWNGGLSLA